MKYDVYMFLFKIKKSAPVNIEFSNKVLIFIKMVFKSFKIKVFRASFFPVGELLLVREPANQSSDVSQNIRL